MNLIKSLHDIQAIKFGDFTLKSGVKSSIYLDLRQIITYPNLLDDIATIISTKIDTNIKRICGVPYAALPLATTVSLKTNTPLIIKRKEAKQYGTKKMIEGEFNQGDEILLLEDVITSGISLVETITELEKEGLKIKKIITIVDRKEGGMDKIKSMGYDIESLLTITDLLDFSPTKLKKSLPKKHHHPKAQQLLDISWKKKTNLIASIDLTKSQHILDLLYQIGDGISAVKLHADIIEDFNQLFVNDLKQISSNKQFLIIEDRKFADIGNTQILQLSRGIHSISYWADFVTIHLIGGESSLKAIQDWESDNKPGLIPILEMSSMGALTDRNYQNNCKRFVYNYKDVVGLVAQQSEVDNRFLKFTPGVNLTDKGDNKGQQYNSPEFAIQELNSDFLIVGRGLYNSDDPKQQLENYLTQIRNTSLFD